MNCAPLNLAHFHERRSEKFLKKHRYDEAYKAVQTSLLYLQDAYKNVQIDKSIEILNTQKWDYERRLRQIEMQKAQYERLKSREIVPIIETSAMMKPTETNLTAQSVAKSIDRTIENFDTKVLHTMPNAEQSHNKEQGKYTKAEMANCEYIDVNTTGAGAGASMTVSEPTCGKVTNKMPELQQIGNSEDYDEMPSLTPLELPSFDINLFTSSSAPSLASFHCLAEHLQK